MIGRAGSQAFKILDLDNRFQEPQDFSEIDLTTIHSEGPRNSKEFMGLAWHSNTGFAQIHTRGLNQGGHYTIALWEEDALSGRVSGTSELFKKSLSSKQSKLLHEQTTL